ncbi:hypothetical protein [Streptomyces sp. NPDC057623]|uniref:hypothetical protein n=1 Tax=Streptomyces sp. NPDC057623 TaxID=3346187 RepID=UPI0036C71DD3
MTTTTPGGPGGAPDTNPDNTPDRGAELARVQLSEAREELVRADGKAGLLLASLGATLTALLGAIGSGLIAPRQYPVVPQLLLWVGCAACVPALTLLGLAVTPRLGDPHRKRTFAGTDPASRDVSQLTVLSQIAWTKYRRIHHALAWGTAFFTLTLLGLVTGWWT